MHVKRRRAAVPTAPTMMPLSRTHTLRTTMRLGHVLVTATTMTRLRHALAVPMNTRLALATATTMTRLRHALAVPMMMLLGHALATATTMTRLGQALAVLMGGHIARRSSRVLATTMMATPTPTDLLSVRAPAMEERPAPLPPRQTRGPPTGWRTGTPTTPTTRPLLLRHLLPPLQREGRRWRGSASTAGTEPR